MKCLLSLAAVALLVCAADCYAAAPVPKGANWQSDLHKAHSLAARQNRPMVVVFGSDNCLYCHKMARTTLVNGRIVNQLQQSFVPVYLDYYQNERAAEVLEVKSLPSIIILSPNAQLLGKVVGFADVPKFNTTLNNALKAQQKLVSTSTP